MSARLLSIERQTILAPLALRFRDAVTGESVEDGLVVEVYRAGDAAGRARAHPNRSGVFVLHKAKGLGDITRGAGDQSFWDNPPPAQLFTVEVFDERRRYQPFSFKAGLPARGIFQWTWPLLDSTAAPQPEPSMSFRDDFDDNTRDAARWNVSTLNTPPAADPLVKVEEKNARLEITPLTGQGGRHYNGYLSAATWNATGARVGVEVVQATQSAETIFAIATDSNNWYRFVAQSPNLSFQSRVGGASMPPLNIAYNAAQQRFWRFRHVRAGDQISFETSPDARTWTRQRSVPRQIPLTALSVELSAGTSQSVTTPGKAVFDNFLMEANPVPALPLFSAPARVAPAGMAVVRAELWNPLTDRPASFALLEARVTNGQSARTVADREGRAALFIPYPEPLTPVDAQGKPLPTPPYTKQEWTVELRARYRPLDPLPTLPDLAAALAQPRAVLWSDEARNTPLTRATLRSGRPLVVRTNKTTPTPSPEPTPLAVLLITPAA